MAGAWGSSPPLSVGRRSWALSSLPAGAGQREEERDEEQEEVENDDEEEKVEDDDVGRRS